jgi:hypothetical protein
MGAKRKKKILLIIINNLNVALRQRYIYLCYQEESVKLRVSNPVISCAFIRTFRKIKYDQLKLYFRLIV